MQNKTQPKDSQSFLDLKELRNQNCKCTAHRLKAFFFCTQKCNAFLCQKCFLDHKQHSDSVIVIDDLLSSVQTSFQDLEIEKVKQIIYQRQQKNILKIQELSDLVFNLLQEHKNFIQNNFIGKNHKIPRLKTTFHQQTNEIQFELKNKVKFTKKILKQLSKARINYDLIVNEKELAQKFLSQIQKNYEILNSLNASRSNTLNTKKILHWFEWEKRELNILDVDTLNHTNIKLVTPFRTLSFSRSVLTPKGAIFLIGGEVPLEYHKTNFYFNLKNLEFDQSLYEKSPLLSAVFDFSLIYHNEFLYVFGGKDRYNNIQSSCQCYDIQKNSWTYKKESVIKRYAHSACLIQETSKAYLFGGRDYTNSILSTQIEIYDIKNDEWELQTLKMPNFIIPLEIPCSIQVKPYKILIFGGIGSKFNEKKNCFIFNSKKFTLKKAKGLQEKSAFVNDAIRKGNFIYAIGNNFSMNKRVLHEYNIKNKEWFFKRYF